MTCARSLPDKSLAFTDKRKWIWLQKEKPAPEKSGAGFS
jgi:hypothetical protein